MKLTEAIKKLEYLHKAWSDPLSGWTNDGRSEMSATLLPILKNHDRETAAKRDKRDVFDDAKENDRCTMKNCPLLAKSKKGAKG